MLECILPKRIEIHSFITKSIKPIKFKNNKDEYIVLLLSKIDPIPYDQVGATLYNIVSDIDFLHYRQIIDIEQTDLPKTVQLILSKDNWTDIETLFAEQMKLLRKFHYYCEACNTRYLINYIHDCTKVKNVLNSFGLGNDTVIEKVMYSLCYITCTRLSILFQQNSIKSINDLTTKRMSVKDFYKDFIDTNTNYVILDKVILLGDHYQLIEYGPFTKATNQFAFVVYYYDEEFIKNILQILDELIVRLTLLSSNTNKKKTIEWFLKFVSNLYVLLQIAYNNQTNNEIAIIQYYKPSFIFDTFTRNCFYDLFSIPMPVLIASVFKIHELLNEDKLFTRETLNYTLTILSLEYIVQLACNSKSKKLTTLLQNNEDTLIEDNDLYLLFNRILNENEVKDFINFLRDVIDNFSYIHSQDDYLAIQELIKANDNIRIFVNTKIEGRYSKNSFEIGSIGKTLFTYMHMDFLVTNYSLCNLEQYIQENKERAYDLLNLDEHIAGIYRNQMLNNENNVKLLFAPMTLKVVY